MQQLVLLKMVVAPSTGWIKALRLALGMPSRYLADRLEISRQGVYDLERREKEGSITINTLREAASAMDMQLVYGLVPNDGSLENLIERKARELAKQIVLRTSNTMKLEDQENTPERIEKAINERADALKAEMPKALWD